MECRKEGVCGDPHLILQKEPFMCRTHQLSILAALTEGVRFLHVKGMETEMILNSYLPYFISTELPYTVIYFYEHFSHLIIR